VRKQGNQPIMTYVTAKSCLPKLFKNKIGADMKTSISYTLPQSHNHGDQEFQDTTIIVDEWLCHLNSKIKNDPKASEDNRSQNVLN
jgi:hypothetical protein